MSRRSARPAPPAPTARPIWGVALIVAAVGLAYLPALRAGFIWDDDTFLTANPLIRAADGLRRFWFTTQAPDYWPVTSTTLWAEWRLWGLHAVGYHATNLALHAAESVLLWRVLRRLAIPGAFLAALLFAVHPVNVESVAWIAQRKNLMAMLFYLASIDCFLRVDWARPAGAGPGGDAGPAPARRSGLWYGLSLLAFVLGMLSKGSIALLPAVLAGIIGWRRRLGRRDLARLAPFFLVAAGLAAVDVWFQHHNAAGAIRSVGPLTRLLGAGAVVGFYLEKALLPIHLSFIYPQWHIRTDELRWWIPDLAAVLATAVFWRWRAGWGRRWLFTWGYFCLALVPVMGLTDVYFMRYSLVADHYAHLAIIGVVSLAGAGWARWRAAAGARSRGPALAGAAVVLVLAGLTWRRCRIYRNAGTLYAATLASNPGAWLADNNWGILLSQEGKLAEAKMHFEAALRLNPQCAEAESNLGWLLIKEGRYPEAAARFEAEVGLVPDSFRARCDLAGALAHLPGREPAAIAEYEAALRLDPDSAEAQSNLGYLLTGVPGRLPEAIRRCERALRLKPDFPEAQNNLGGALAKAGRVPEAIVHLEEALRLKPNYPEAYYNLGNALAQVGQWPEAARQYEAAVRLRPGYAQAHNNLGNVFLLMPGHLAEAIVQYRTALRLRPAGPPEVHVNLGRALLEAPGGRQEAIAQFREALRMRPGLASARYFLRQLHANSAP